MKLADIYVPVDQYNDTIAKAGSGTTEGEPLRAELKEMEIKVNNNRKKLEDEAKHWFLCM